MLCQCAIPFEAIARSESNHVTTPAFLQAQADADAQLQQLKLERNERENTLYNEVAAFATRAAAENWAIEGAGLEGHAFPCSLSSEDRGFIHSIAAELGVEARSQGSGDHRYI